MLDIWPRADGPIPEEDVHGLKEPGKWNAKNGEAIFNTIAGLQGHFYGATTLSKDSIVLYLFLPDQRAGNAMIKVLLNQIKMCRY